MPLEAVRPMNSRSPKQTLANLEEDVFLGILEFLDAWDVIRCQKVCRAWRQAFTKDEYLRFGLKRYTSAREVRRLEWQGLLSQSADLSIENWPSIFDTIASRYYHLTHGKARRVEKHKLAALEQLGHWLPIAQWDYHESQPGGRLYHENAASHLSRLGEKPYLFHQGLWTYDDGLLVYAPAPNTQAQVDTPTEKHGYILTLLNVQNGQTASIPFSIDGKIIRNIRLNDRTLVVEWAERKPFHSLNDLEKVHRHFASCFDFCFSQASSLWIASFRSEWKIHFLGLPLNARDRFFSTHSSNHYAVYFWQPNRSMYHGDEDRPIESLIVFDISTPSLYLPSNDPTGKGKPDDRAGPSIISRYSFHDLEFLGVRQHSNISLMSLQVDSKCSILSVRENACVAGQGYFDPAERLWCAKTTHFPFNAYGPHLQIEWDGNLPPYRGCNMDSANVEEREKWFLPVFEVVDKEADVRLSLVETCFTGSMVNRVEMRVKALGGWKIMDYDVVKEVGGMGRIAGDERFVVGQNSSMEIVVAKF